MSTASTPKRISLRVAMDQAAAAGRWGEFEQLEAAWRQELAGGGSPTLDSMEARLARLDARRKASPGQLGLDLGGATAAGPGGGQPCGRAWIDPSYTCHVGAGQAGSAPAAAPIDTAQPFPPAVMARIKMGIVQRSFGPSAARHTGGDLANALEVLAGAEGEQGQNARSAMAFMDEIGAKVIIAPPRETLKGTLQFKAEMPSWDENATAEKNLEVLDTYLEDGLNTVKRLRNMARRNRYPLEEMLAAYREDNTPHAENAADRIEEGLYGADNEAMGAIQEHRDMIGGLVEQYNAEEDQTARKDLRDRIRQHFGALRNESLYIGAHHAGHSLMTALENANGLRNTGGHYYPGSNVYYRVSGAAANTHPFLRAPEIRPGQMGAQVGDAIDLSTGRLRGLHSTSSVIGLNGSESSLMTHLHELGHMVHDASGRKVYHRAPGGLLATGPDPSGQATVVSVPSDSTKKAPPHIKQIVRDRGGPTQYANTNVAEVFAESFAAYVVAPKALKDSYPELYEWVSKSLVRARSYAVRSKGATNHINI